MEKKIIFVLDDDSKMKNTNMIREWISEGFEDGDIYNKSFKINETLDLEEEFKDESLDQLEVMGPHILDLSGITHGEVPTPVPLPFPPA